VVGMLRFVGFGSDMRCELIEESKNVDGKSKDHGKANSVDGNRRRKRRIVPFSCVSSERVHSINPPLLL
jgi:hypothetical protein